MDYECDFRDIHEYQKKIESSMGKSLHPISSYVKLEDSNGKTNVYYFSEQPFFDFETLLTSENSLKITHLIQLDLECEEAFQK